MRQIFFQLQAGHLSSVPKQKAHHLDINRENAVLVSLKCSRHHPRTLYSIHTTPLQSRPFKLTGLLRSQDSVRKTRRNFSSAVKVTVPYLLQDSSDTASSLFCILGQLHWSLPHGHHGPFSATSGPRQFCLVPVGQDCLICLFLEGKFGDEFAGGRNSLNSSILIEDWFQILIQSALCFGLALRSELRDKNSEIIGVKTSGGVGRVGRTVQK